MKKLRADQRKALLATLQRRFEDHHDRHRNVSWPAVAARLESAPAAVWTLGEMERSGGEPDVVGYDAAGDSYLFCDCARESPAGRRSLCYDRAALDARATHKPGGSAVEQAASMGIELLTVEQYHALQALGPFDTRTSSWLLTPPAIRRLGGAIFGDYRYGTVFVYHNGAESYYAARGYRGLLRV
jgi:Protein of unknown function (DUF4256)